MATHQSVVGADWRKVCALGELPDGQPVHVDLDGVPICLIRVGDQVHALYDECSHESVPLSDGEVDDDAIECCQHGSQFRLTTGEALNLPATDSVRVFPLKVAGDGQIYVAVDSVS